MRSGAKPFGTGRQGYCSQGCLLISGSGGYSPHLDLCRRAFKARNETMSEIWRWLVLKLK